MQELLGHIIVVNSYTVIRKHNWKTLDTNIYIKHFSVVPYSGEEGKRLRGGTHSRSTEDGELSNSNNGDSEDLRDSQSSVVYATGLSPSLRLLCEMQTEWTAMMVISTSPPEEER